MSNKLFIGHEGSDNRNVLLDRDDLITHAVVVGRTGSGKTGLIHVIVEEAVMQGASAIILDPKGDLTNLMLSFPGLTPQEFAPWVPSGKSATEESEKWRSGLQSSGLGSDNVAEWHNAATFRVFTPGFAKSGQAINLLPRFEAPEIMDTSARERASQIVITILNAIGIDSDPLTDPRNVYLTELLLTSWKNGEALPLEKWAGLIVDPPKALHDFDGIAVDDLFPRKDRLKVASAIVGFRRQAARWLEGPSLNPENLLMVGEDGRPQVSIFTLRHLSADDRQLFVSMFLSGLVDWMYKAPASGRLRALCVLDEAAGYLPPKPYNPPTKQPIMTLLSQGRAQGLGMLIGTQNPNDIDYKALSNVGTWFLGGLRDRDMKRDLEIELKDRGIEASELLGLPERTFFALTKGGITHNLRVRWSLSYLRGPISLTSLEKFTQPVSSISNTSQGSKPKKTLWGNVRLNFDLYDKDSKNLDVEITYSTDGGKNWKTATATPESVGLIGLPSSPSGRNHTFIWDTVADLGYKFVPQVSVCIRPSGSSGLIMPPTDVVNDSLEPEDTESFNF